METEESIQKRIDDIKNDCDKIWKQFMDMAILNVPYNKAYSWYKNQPIIQYKLKIERKLRNIKEGNMEPIPKYGDHFTLKEFVDCCDCGLFINSDGTGYYATETEMSDIEIYPSDVIDNDYRKDFTHVVWFNK